MAPADPTSTKAMPILKSRTNMPGFLNKGLKRLFGIVSILIGWA